MHHAPQERRTYFLTAVTAQRRALFQVEATCHLMLQVLKTNQDKSRFHLHAFVLMPDHLHLLLTPAPDISLEKAMQLIKGGFSFLLKSKRDVWERSYNETRILDTQAFQNVKIYIEQNPIRKGLAPTPNAFPFSSASRPDLLGPTPPWFQSKDSSEE